MKTDIIEIKRSHEINILFNLRDLNIHKKDSNVFSGYRFMKYNEITMKGL